MKGWEDCELDERDTRGKKSGWAPGLYPNRCELCNDYYIGDKKSTMCAPCAYDHFPSLKKQSYNIIYADPPWSYRDRAGKRGASAHYKTMSIDQICDLRVGHLAADDCILFMWVTMPMLLDCKRIFDAWGFDYKTVGFTWIKKTTTGLDVFGMGSYTRANPELCLIGTRGKLKRQSASVRQLVRAVRPQRHSQKPAVIRDKIVELCGDLPRIELFARQRVEGWDAWGNDLEAKDISGTCEKCGDMLFTKSKLCHACEK